MKSKHLNSPKKMKPLPKEAVLDVDRVNVCEDGVVDYFYPLAQRDLISLKMELLETSKNLIYQNLRNEDWRILHIVYIEIIRELMVIMRSAKLLSEAEKLNVNIQASEKHFPYLNEMKKNASLLEVVRQRLRYLTTPLPCPSKYLKPLRYIKFFLDKSVFKRRVLYAMKPEDIIAFASSNFMSNHAKKLQEEGKVVTLCSFWEWYDVNAYALNPEFKGILNDAQNSLLSGLKEICQKNNFPFSQNIEKAIALSTFNFCFVASVYRDHLLKQNYRKKLPKILWFGSSNELRARVLRATVQECGGYTIGHDHGRGFAMALNDGELGTVFDFCNELNVYSSHIEKQITEYQNALMQKERFFNAERQPVVFNGIDDTVITKGDINQYNLKRQKPVVKPAKPKVMIMAGVFKGEHFAGLNTLPNDITFLDFQIKLINKFNSLGYQVLLKAHPESSISYPESFAEKFDVEIIGGYVEDQVQNVDLVVFDFLSSAFKTLAMTNVPMIYFDFGYGYFVGDIGEYFESRVSIMMGHFNEENRAQIDWDDLEKTIKVSKEKTSDTTLLEKVFGVTDRP